MIKDREIAMQLEWLTTYLLNEEGAPQAQLLEELSLFDRWRLLVNVRPPHAIAEEYLVREDDFLQAYNRSQGFVALEDLRPVEGANIFLWQGDITRLKVDGIVNAANSDLVGCFIPNHNCIDNIIHTKAGMKLRLACHDLMQAQGRKEPVGKAKITPAYNLPSNYVIHTVGPTARGRVTAINQKLLAQSYKACLALADEHQLESLAFCCISTGVFGYPNEAAADIAIKTVRDYLAETKTELKVVFNVFEDQDLEIYQEKLGKEDA